MSETLYNAVLSLVEELSTAHKEIERLTAELAQTKYLLKCTNEELSDLVDLNAKQDAELSALREAALWVNVGDRLPTPEQSVLMSNGNAVETGCYFAGNWWQNGSKVRITHWRPLPTPPEAP